MSGASLPMNLIEQKPHGVLSNQVGKIPKTNKFNLLMAKTVVGYSKLGLSQLEFIDHNVKPNPRNTILGSQSSNVVKPDAATSSKSTFRCPLEQLMDIHSSPPAEYQTPQKNKSQSNKDSSKNLTKFPAEIKSISPPIPDETNQKSGVDNNDTSLEKKEHANSGPQVNLNTSASNQQDQNPKDETGVNLHSVISNPKNINPSVSLSHGLNQHSTVNATPNSITSVGSKTDGKPIIHQGVNQHPIAKTQPKSLTGVIIQTNSEQPLKPELNPSIAVKTQPNSSPTKSADVNFPTNNASALNIDVNQEELKPQTLHLKKLSTTFEVTSKSLERSADESVRSNKVSTNSPKIPSDKPDQLNVTPQSNLTQSKNIKTTFVLGELKLDAQYHPQIKAQSTPSSSSTLAVKDGSSTETALPTSNNNLMVKAETSTIDSSSSSNEGPTTTAVKTVNSVKLSSTPSTSSNTLPTSGSSLTFVSLEQVEQTVLTKIQLGNQNVRLHLQPESLGHLDVHIRIEEGQIFLKLQTESLYSAALLRQALGDLQTTFSDNGLSLGGFDINHGQDQPSSSKQSPGQLPSKTDNSKTKSQSDEKEEQPKQHISQDSNELDVMV